MRAEAELDLDEGMRVAPIGAARVVPQRHLAWYPTLGGTAAILIGGLLYAFVTWLAMRAGWRDEQGYLAAVLGLAQLMLVAFGLALGWNLAVRQYQRKFVAAVRQRGAPAVNRFSYRIEDEGLVIESPRTSHTLRWEAILEVFPAPEHWLILQDTLTFNIPKRAFATAEDEAAFLRELLSRLTPAALERSREARELAGA